MIVKNYDLTFLTEQEDELRASLEDLNLGDITN